MTGIEELTEKSNLNYPPSSQFIIEKMWLRIEPDFERKRITGEEQLKLLARQNINDVELDIGEGVEIKSILFSTGADASTNYDRKELTHNTVNEKLIIHLGNTIKEGTRFSIVIDYIAQGSIPGKGIHFVNESTDFPAHAWTQSESIYARNWFPCLDHPQVKFPREVSVIVPQDYIVISNGELDMTQHDIETKGVSKKIFVWEESNPDATYLTSVVIGKFIETSGGQNYDGIPLRYYVPEGRDADSRRTFKNTDKMIKIFEEYFNVKYPYNKYSQVVAKGLGEAGIDGMEHTTCTTLDIDSVLVSIDAPQDVNTDDVIAHELAHQWFGDLVTCRDWQHIWLNEGFAAFCEALYIEKSKGEQEYQQSIMKMISYYLSMTRIRDPRIKTPTRAIVTKEYEHPDDLFDHNTYAKGGIILHMLRKYIGDEDFRKSIETYLYRFKDKTAETDDLRQIMEEVSGINLQHFFDQWIYREGHPKLNLHISNDNGKVKLSITQGQEGDAFVFPLEINFVLTNGIDGSEQNSKMELVELMGKNFSRTFDIPMDKIDYISIDPEYKILKEYISIDSPDDIIRNQIRGSKTTFEKVEAANFLKKRPLSAKIFLQDMKMILSKDQPLSLIKEASEGIDSIFLGDNKNENYEYLKKSLQETKDPTMRKVLIEGIGNFKKMESYALLKEIIQDENADPYERYSAAIAIANTGHEESLSLLKTMSDHSSYHNLVARGCIEGLKIIAIKSEEASKQDIGNFIVEKMRKTKESRLKRSAASALGYLGRYKEDKTKIIQELIGLLNDESFYVRNTACVALANVLENTGNEDVIKELEHIAERDPSSEVRATANACITIIQGDSKKKEKRRLSILDEETKMDSTYRSEKFDILEKIKLYH